MHTPKNTLHGLRIFIAKRYKFGICRLHCDKQIDHIFSVTLSSKLIFDSAFIDYLDDASIFLLKCLDLQKAYWLTLISTYQKLTLYVLAVFFISWPQKLQLRKKTY